MPEIIQRLADEIGISTRPYELGGVVLLALYALQAEIRFGAKARAHRADAPDRHRSVVLSLAAGAPVMGLVVAVKWAHPAVVAQHPVVGWLFGPSLPGLPVTAWIGAAVGL